MSLRRGLALLLLPLAGCGDNGGDGAGKVSGNGPGARLEAAAIESGLIPDPDDIIVSGRFERRSDVGTDKFCAISEGEAEARIGMLAVFGADSQCEARGTARWQGEQVHLELSGKETCSFDAQFDGVALQLPGSLPRGCESYCNGRGSFSGVQFFLVETGDAAARSSRGRDFDRLCE